MHLLLSPHNDDEALFASYLCLQHRPLVLTALDGGRRAHFATPETRVQESMAAMAVLGCEYDHLWVPMEQPVSWESVERRIQMHCTDPEWVWAPFPEANGHRHHNHLGELATRMWPGRVSFYTTYSVVDDVVTRTVVGEPLPRTYGWDELKRQALACYPSQLKPGTQMHFDAALDEYVVPTLRLNLGGEINRIPGYVDMDVSYGWKFEDGLGMWGTGSVEAITESHSLMYVAPEDWEAAFAEMVRVLQPGGFIRITQDDIGGPGSTRRHIRPGAAVETNPELVLHHLAQAGIDARVVAPDETSFRDRTLIQQNYGQPPDVFHVEGQKPPRV